MNKQRNQSTTGRITQGAAIAALYVALTMIVAPIAFGPVQFRIARIGLAPGKDARPKRGSLVVEPYPHPSGHNNVVVVTADILPFRRDIGNDGISRTRCTKSSRRKEQQIQIPFHSIVGLVDKCPPQAGYPHRRPFAKI